MKIKIFIIISISTFFVACKDDDTKPAKQGSKENVSLEQVVVPLNDTNDLDTLMSEIGNAQYVLLGEASHGTQEYYAWRAEITKRLITEKGFNVIGVEGDWPDLYKLNQYINNPSGIHASAEEVLSEMNRWPTWMWANQEVAALGEWLKQHNQTSGTTPVNFYGLDLYSLWPSMNEVLDYLEAVDPASADYARSSISCFAPYQQQDEFAYAQAKEGGTVDCADELAKLLEVVQQKAQRDPNDEAAFNALQNAVVAVNGERYIQRL
jgi:erythromycin esterase